ncbi:FecR family protein [Filimonas lacunae]|uniref:FecR family protein n=1 Tax=Filimonas lacunae TaxID=477680 RepID=A0A173MDI3_9BACT|nr:FecR family protein [Filimonas lacunae]BAV05539.1 anti-sigma factor [Filimonas lacunae]SIT20489.1 FecR family protein [Filimonas lacunae]
MVSATAKLTALFQQHLQGKLSPLEKQELAALSMQEELQPLLQQLTEDAWHTAGEELDLLPEKVEATRKFLAQQRRDEKRTVSFPLVGRKWWWAAASLLFLLALGLLLAINRDHVIDRTALSEDIRPGGNGAILTLPDGKQVPLDSNHNTIPSTTRGKALPAASYTISTTRGKQFQVVLPDGSRAWLNTASSITYPAVFNGHARKVSITGEVYFEVTTLSASKPFEVSCNGQTVTVLGTQFNVNSYNDDSLVKTTLREGRVRVTSRAGNVSQVLEPAQQAQVAANGTMEVKEVNADEVMAWQAGYFNLTNVPFREMMQRLSRWYDIEIKYETHIPQIEFEGRLNQSVNLSRVLQFLKESGVQYRLDNHTLIIL